MKKKKNKKNLTIKKQLTMTEDNFKWTDELVMEIIGLTHRAGYHKEPAKVYDRVIQFKQSKLQSQDKQVGWEILELIFWSGEKTTDFLVIQNWLRGDKRYEKWSIYSVKRLSDGEVFTIGDKCTLSVNPIVGFEIVGDQMKVLTEARGNWQWLSSISHIKEIQPSSIDRIEVLKIGNRVDITTPEWPKAYYLQFCTSKEVHSDKFHAIKQAIEDALNESDTINIDWAAPPITEKYYTQSEVDTIREETWKAARETTFSFKGEQDFPNPKIKYPTLQDYLNSLSKETKPKEEDKPVLFITEDGVEIRNGDHAFYVQDDNNWMVVSHSGITEKRPYPYFHTSESANKWVLENKPCLSLNEVKELANNNGAKVLCIPDEKISNYTKQKLNQQ